MSNIVKGNVKYPHAAIVIAKIVSEYDQEIPQSQTADNSWHREEKPLNHHETLG